MTFFSIFTLSKKENGKQGLDLLEAYSRLGRLPASAVFSFSKLKVCNRQYPSLHKSVFIREDDRSDIGNVLRLGLHHW